MQKTDFKFSLFIGLILALTFWPLDLNAQPVKKLETADSLFTSKRFTQSLELYNEILEEHYATPAMLLKMAYISEGLDKPEEALFYLNLYQLKTSDKSAQIKMEEMASDFGLSGYETNSDDFISSLFNRFRNQLILLISAFAIFSAAVGIYNKRKYNTRPIFPVILSLLFTAVLFYVVNFAKSSRYAIIHDGSSPVMEGPSAASNLVSLAGAGHKVRILKSGEIWVRILWNDREAYIRKNHLRLLGDYL